MVLSGWGSGTTSLGSWKPGPCLLLLATAPHHTATQTGRTVGSSDRVNVVQEDGQPRLAKSENSRMFQR